MTQTTLRLKAAKGADVSAFEAGVATGTTTLTMEGEMPVEVLNPVDAIITRRGVGKVKAVLRHTLPKGTPCVVPEGTPCVVVSKDTLGGKPDAPDPPPRPRSRAGVA